MIGRVTRQMLPHLPGVPHLHVNRPQERLAWVATLSYAVVLCYDLVSRCRLSAF